MCLFLHNIFETKEAANEFAANPMIADRNILVYKLLTVRKDGSLISPNRNVEYSRRTSKQVQAFGTKVYSPNGEIYKITVEEGLHAYVRLSWAEKMKCDYTVFEMYIPKGTPYFLGTNEIVSLKLKWVHS